MNTTARKNEKTVEKASPYLINGTYATIIANLTRPIGPFDEEKELAKYKAEQRALSPDEEGGETHSPKGSARKSQSGEETEKDKEMRDTKMSF